MSKICYKWLSTLTLWVNRNQVKTLKAKSFPSLLKKSKKASLVKINLLDHVDFRRFVARVVSVFFSSLHFFCFLPLMIFYSSLTSFLAELSPARSRDFFATEVTFNQHRLKQIFKSRNWSKLFWTDFFVGESKVNRKSTFFPNFFEM